MTNQLVPFRALFIQIGRRRYEVADFKQASEMYSTARQASMLGAAKVPPAHIVNERGEFVARISYNGRVWASRDYVEGESPIYDNRVSP